MSAQEIKTELRQVNYRFGNSSNQYNTTNKDLFHTQGSGGMVKHVTKKDKSASNNVINGTSGQNGQYTTTNNQNFRAYENRMPGSISDHKQASLKLRESNFHLGQQMQGSHANTREANRVNTGEISRRGGEQIMASLSHIPGSSKTDLRQDKPSTVQSPAKVTNFTIGGKAKAEMGDRFQTTSGNVYQSRGVNNDQSAIEASKQTKKDLRSVHFSLGNYTEDMKSHSNTAFVKYAQDKDSKPDFGKKMHKANF